MKFENFLKSRASRLESKIAKLQATKDNMLDLGRDEEGKWFEISQEILQLEKKLATYNEASGSTKSFN